VSQDGAGAAAAVVVVLPSQAADCLAREVQDRDRAHPDLTVRYPRTLVVLGVFIVGKIFVVSAELLKKSPIEQRMVTVRNKTGLRQGPVTRTAIANPAILRRSDSPLEARVAYCHHRDNDRGRLGFLQILYASGHETARVFGMGVGSHDQGGMW
jgi:hypothetical protein